MKLLFGLGLIIVFSKNVYAQPRVQIGAGLNYKTSVWFPTQSPNFVYASPVPYNADDNIAGLGLNLLAEIIPLNKFSQYSIRADAEVRYDYMTDKYTYSNPLDPYRKKIYNGIIFNAHPMLYRRFGKKLKLGVGYSVFNIGKHFTYYNQYYDKTTNVDFAFQALSFSIAYPVWKQRLWINHRLWYTTGGYAIEGDPNGALIFGINVEYFFYRSKKQAGEDQ